MTNVLAGGGLKLHTPQLLNNPSIILSIKIDVLTVYCQKVVRNDNGNIPEPDVIAYLIQPILQNSKMFSLRSYMKKV